jgi:hypothetical protein
MMFEKRVQLAFIIVLLFVLLEGLGVGRLSASRKRLELVFKSASGDGRDHAKNHAMKIVTAASKIPAHRQDSREHVAAEIVRLRRTICQSRLRT